MNAIIFGKEANDQPENPLDDISRDVVPLAKISPDMRSPDTDAQKRDSFYQPGDPAINAKGAAGPKGPMTMPGGSDMVTPPLTDSLTSGMQHSRESGKDYEGKDTRGTVMKSSKTSTGPIYQDQ